MAILGLSLMTVVVTAGCGSSHGADGDDRELVPDCAAYIERLHQCMTGVSPEIVSQRMTNTRQALSVPAKDDSARERLGAQCRAATEQLSRACR